MFLLVSRFWLRLHILSQMINSSLTDSQLTDHTLRSTVLPYVGLPPWLSGKESSCSVGDTGSILGSGRSPILSLLIYDMGRISPSQDYKNKVKEPKTKTPSTQQLHKCQLIFSCYIICKSWNPCDTWIQGQMYDFHYSENILQVEAISDLPLRLSPLPETQVLNK